MPRNAVYNYFMLSRPLNSTLAGFAVAIGALASLSHPLTDIQLWYIVLGCITSGFISAFGYVINDVFDVEIDRINMPHRPIPSGSVSLQGAKLFCAFLAGVGAIFAVLIDLVAIFLAFMGIVLLYLYAAYFKRSGFPGNLIVASLATIPFLFGGFVTESFPTLLIPASFSFLINLSRELIKDIEDVHGDKLEDVQSVALKYGIRPARNISYIFLASLLVIIPIPIFFGIYKSIPFMIAVVIIFGALIYTVKLTFKPTEDEIIAGTTSAKRILKTCMTIGVIGFLSEGILNLIHFTFG